MAKVRWEPHALTAIHFVPRVPVYTERPIGQRQVDQLDNKVLCAWVITDPSLRVTRAFGSSCPGTLVNLVSRISNPEWTVDTKCGKKTSEKVILMLHDLFTSIYIGRQARGKVGHLMARGWHGNWRSQIWPAPQPSYYLLQLHISTMNACTCISITCHLSFTILNSLKPLRRTCDFFVDELLSYMSPTLIYRLFCSRIVPMWEFAKSLFHRLPIDLYRS